MSASAADRQHARAAELCVECSAIAYELERLEGEEAELQKRACQIHGLLVHRTAQLRKEQRELSGLVDGVAAVTA